MKKILISVIVIVSLVGLSACKKEKKEVATSIESISLSMEQLETSENTSSTERSKTQESSKETKEENVDIKKLLMDFGNAYGNYSSINDRNSKLKKLMTDECIKMNGIDFDSAVMLASTGAVVDVYAPMKEESNQYAVLVEAEQNGFKVRILLLVKVTGNKVSEMTYNTVKKEY